MHVRTVRFAVVGLGAVFLVVLSGCGSSGDSTVSPSKSGSAPPSAIAAPTSAASGASGTAQAGDVSKAVTDAYVTFFDGKTPADKKIALVENGDKFAQTINAQASSPMATGTTATVINVKQEAPQQASVIYTVSINGTPALQNQEGAAVESDGKWKVAAKTFCSLLTMEGNPPPICGAPSAAAPTS